MIALQRSQSHNESHDRSLTSDRPRRPRDERESHARVPGLRRPPDRAAWKAGVLALPDDLRNVLRGGPRLTPIPQNDTASPGRKSLTRCPRSRCEMCWAGSMPPIPGMRPRSSSGSWPRLKPTGASDVHFQPGADALELRWRLDGVLHPVALLPAKVAPNIVARLKVLGRAPDLSDRRSAGRADPGRRRARWRCD